ncbi:MAG: SIR2 family NAD-dependent protein deacylase [Desulfotomaculales bacterium]
MREAREIADLLRTAKNAYVLTGAGISTESGIPDFRSPGTGLWTTTSLADLLTAEVLKEDPRRFYEACLPALDTFRRAEPNPAHIALAELESLGYIRGVITQNIDGLHQRAGSRRVWEVHGHLRTVSCMRCERKQPFDFAVACYRRGELPPRCRVCNGVMRPDVVLFGEALARDFFEAADELYGGCDFMLVVGSSLTVYPAAGLVTLTKKLAIINLQPTPYDARAHVVVREKAGAVLPLVVEACKKWAERGEAH